MSILESGWRWRYRLARDARTESARRRLAALAKRGELVRVVPGAYLEPRDWEGLDPRARHIALLRAVALTADRPVVFSHVSAAALWGLPIVGHLPSRADALGSRAQRGSTRFVRRHIEPTRRFVEIDGLLVTELPRTVVDVARLPDLERSVAITDAALHRAGPAEQSMRDLLETELARVPTRHGSARARHVLDFADGRADSPGESVSRLTMDRLGLDSPVLQQEFPREGGGRWVVDFWWPEQGVIGEFDGAAKYLDPAWRGARSAEQVVLDEKRREDELRSGCRGFARWGWEEARSPARLAVRLRRAGLSV